MKCSCKRKMDLLCEIITDSKRTTYYGCKTCGWIKYKTKPKALYTT